MITAQQKNFFETFGFLVLQQALSPQEMRDIDQAFESVIEEAMAERGVQRDRQKLGEKFVIDPGFCERSPVLTRLPDDPRIGGTAQQLLDPAARYVGSDGALRVGDTLWHPDTGWDPNVPMGPADPNFKPDCGHYYAGIKTSFYLDPVEARTGCLSVIPGSHLSPIHESLASLHCDIPDRAAHLLDDPAFKQFALPDDAVPCYPIESEPGDVVFFSNMLWHAAFGGPTGRRAFTINFKGEPTNDGQREFTEYQSNLVKKFRETAGRG